MSRATEHESPNAKNERNDEVRSKSDEKVKGETGSLGKLETGSLGKLREQPLTEMACSTGPKPNEFDKLLKEFSTAVKGLQCSLGDGQEKKIELNILLIPSEIGHLAVGVSQAGQPTKIFGFYPDLPQGFAQTGMVTLKFWGDLTAVLTGVPGMLPNETIRDVAKATQVITIGLTPEQSEAFFQEVQQWKSKDYKLGTQDCVSFVQSALGSVGVDVSRFPSHVKPEGFLNALKERFGSGHPRCLGEKAASSTRLRGDL